jgi:AraC-like DNA-binding protein
MTSKNPSPAVPPVGSDRLPGLALHRGWLEPSVHSAYFQIFARLLTSQGLAGPRPFTGQPRQLPLLDFLPLLDAIDAPRCPQAGVDLGHAVQTAAHGPMGLAAMSSDSLWAAMQTVARYAPIRNHLFHYRCERAGGQACLLMTIRLDLGPYSHFIQNATLYALFNLFRAMADAEGLRQASVGLPWPGPKPSARVPGQTWRTDHGSPVLSIRFPLAVADLPLASSDPDLHRRVCAAGEEELTKLAGSIRAKVRHLMHAAQPAWPTLVDAATALGLSRRTLVRKLEAEGTGYQRLLDEARHELACWHLRQSSLSLGEVAEKLGFSDAGNFSRGFRRWQGLTPNQYRRQVRSA